jgi:hypothetical protein
MMWMKSWLEHVRMVTIASVRCPGSMAMTSLGSALVAVRVIGMMGLGDELVAWHLVPRCTFWMVMRMWWALRSSLGFGWGHEQPRIGWRPTKMGPWWTCDAWAILVVVVTVMVIVAMVLPPSMAGEETKEVTPLLGAGLKVDEEQHLQGYFSLHSSLITIRGGTIASESFKSYYNTIVEMPNVEISF